MISFLYNTYVFVFILQECTENKCRHDGYALSDKTLKKLECVQDHFANTKRSKFQCCVCKNIIPANHKLGLCYECENPATFVHQKNCWDKLMNQMNKDNDTDSVDFDAEESDKKNDKNNNDKKRNSSKNNLNKARGKRFIYREKMKKKENKKQKCDDNSADTQS